MKFHPGEFVRDELSARGWSIESLSRLSGLSRERIESLLSEKRNLTRLDAYGLSRAFGTGEEVWINLQASFSKGKI